MIAAVGVFALLDKFDETMVVAPDTIGAWSVKDMIGHVVDWEVRMLKLQLLHFMIRTKLPP